MLSGAVWGGELVEPALGCGKSRAELAVVVSRGVFPGHQRARLPGCSSHRVNRWLVLPARWGKVSAFVLGGKEQQTLLMNLKVQFVTDWSQSSKCLLGPAALCGRLRWGFLAGSSYFKQPGQVYRNILTALA